MTPEDNTGTSCCTSVVARSAAWAVPAVTTFLGFEDAKAIGTGLADWGRKEPSKLAFEQVVQYIAQENFVHGHGHVHNIEQALDPHNADPDSASSWKRSSITSAKASSGKSSASRVATTTG